MFKKAHVECKKVVIDAAGKKAVGSDDSHWTFDDTVLDKIQPQQWSRVLESLQRLVISYDNMPDDLAEKLTSVKEVFKNLDWLMKMSLYAVDSAETKAIKSSKRAPFTRTASSGSIAVAPRGAPPPGSPAGSPGRAPGGRDDALEIQSMAGSDTSSKARRPAMTMRKSSIKNTKAQLRQPNYASFVDNLGSHDESKSVTSTDSSAV